MSRTTVSQNGENLDLEKRELSGSTSHDEHSSSEAVGAATVRDSSLGTFYQSKVNLRRGFLKNLFLPLDREYMNAVHRDAEGVIYEDGGEEERRIKRKIDNRILPLIILSFVCESSFQDHYHLRRLLNTSMFGQSISLVSSLRCGRCIS